MSRGKSLAAISDFKDFDLSFRAVARIDHGELHQVQSLLRGLQRHGAPVHRPDRCRTGTWSQPYSYDVGSNGKQEAIETRPQPRVREEDCVGCRLCYNVCPVEHCIDMVEVPSGREPVTWDELVKTQAEVTEDWEAMKSIAKRRAFIFTRRMISMALLIRNGEIVTADSRYRGDIYVEDETITRIGRESGSAARTPK